uniref:TolA protein n=1 Tax=Pseudomonas fluorescens (strain SBW25) TaxID=216595 RepID=A0A0G4E4N3_PSEFS|nr:TonB family protein [Pseudomonas fluorescens]CEK42124.1 TolA protein [Pseudomonas fluorescens SBW25]
MKDSKLGYIALTCSVGAVLLYSVSSMISVFPNSSKIDALSHQVQTLTDENVSLVAAAASNGDNRMRINELDVGLTALANVMKIDRTELARAIAAVKAGREADASADQPPQGSALPDASRSAPVLAAARHNVAPESAQPAQIQDQTVAAAQEKPVEAKGHNATSQQVNKRNVTAAQAAPQPESNSGSASLLGADNPFAPPSGTNSAGGEVPGTLEVAASKSEPVTIAQVDSVLGKRLSSNWYKPAGVADDLSTIIQLKMSRDGKVATVRLSKSSGNSAFDNSAINAVKSIGAIDEVRQLTDADFQKAYASRSIQFTPQMGG